MCVAAVIKAPLIYDPLFVAIHSRDQYQAVGCIPGDRKGKYTSQGFDRLGAYSVLPPVYRPQQVSFDPLLIENDENTYRKCCAVDVRHIHLISLR